MTQFQKSARTACGLACGRLGWSPSAFWEATPTDLILALEGVLPREDERPVTMSEMRALMEAGNG
ncbi:phage tail assembly chaperone [Pacificimonas sp. WHA3]|uniref:Phage tail assembly chaperone n=1 Tax=Pacificimonas pallii TaxID=2827236 RepID=A0ABS6SA11_9SPHN|nr:phage tail assembly chaperone [Pacificimonas pallii]MBV7255203.1 phage tail assembly chaperone [Pacificimonas pallii]